MTESPQGPHIGRSIWAVFAGFLVVFITSLGTDQLFHVLKVYPPWGAPMFQPELNALALGYRIIYGILGNLLIYHLAPQKPMKHVWIGAAIGFVLSTAGAIGGIKMGLGPVWYPVALAVSVIPCAWVTGPLYPMLRRRPAG